MINIREKVKEHYLQVRNVYGNRIFFVSLYGSQNYNTATRNSDVDTKALLIPNFEELAHREEVSHIELCEDGICDVKHVDLMFDNIMKMNINFLELLYPKEDSYTVINPLYLQWYYDLIAHRDMIVNSRRYKMLNSAYYMALAKVYEVKYTDSYNPKDYSELKRLYYFIEKYLECEDFESALRLPAALTDNLIDIKTNYYPIEDVIAAVDILKEKLSDFKNIIDEKYCGKDDDRAIRIYLDELYKDILYAASADSEFWDR